MKPVFTRRNIVVAGASAVVLAAAAFEARHLLRKHYPPSPYDDLLAHLDNRDADAQIGEAVLAEIEKFDPNAVAGGLRASLEHRSLAQAVADDAVKGRMVEANGWVLPKTLALLCALAAKAQ